MSISIALIGNCQVSSFARLAAAALPDAALTIVSLEKVKRDGTMDAAAAAAAACDHVFTQPVDHPSFGALRTSELELRLKREPTLYPKVLFRGFHPDCVSVAGQGRMINSPTGNYHSDILIGSFLSGLSVSDALGHFNLSAYRKLRYFEEFESSDERLRQDFATLGYDAAGLARDWMASGCFMYSYNHPALHVMGTVFQLAMARAGFETDVDISGLEDVLARASQWPVYPEFAEQLGVDGRYVFRSSVKDGPFELELEEFARRSYEIYRDVPPELLAKAVGRRTMWVLESLQG